MKRVSNFLRCLLGLVFIVSGAVKTIDARGFSYKLEEYFSPAVFNLPALERLSLPIAVIISLAEIILGLFILTKFKLKQSLVMVMLLCTFFAFLTFYSAYYDVVKDCGCFGDALKLKPWESFWKDIILLIISVFLFTVYQKKHSSSIGNINTKLFLGLSFLLTCGICAYGVISEPIIDFRAYKIGTNLLAEKEKINLNPPVVQTFYSLKNKKTQQRIQISTTEYTDKEEYWAEDSPWELESDKTISKTISEGYVSEVAKFHPTDASGTDQTDAILREPEIYILATHDPKSVQSKIPKQISILKSQHPGKLIVGISPTFGVFPGIPEYQMDGTAIKTIARSNPFILVLQHGKIIAKKPF